MCLLVFRCLLPRSVECMTSLLIHRYRPDVAGTPVNAAYRRRRRGGGRRRRDAHGLRRPRPARAARRCARHAALGAVLTHAHPAPLRRPGGASALSRRTRRRAYTRSCVATTRSRRRSRGRCSARRRPSADSRTEVVADGETVALGDIELTVTDLGRRNRPPTRSGARTRRGACSRPTSRTTACTATLADVVRRAVVREYCMAACGARAGARRCIRVTATRRVSSCSTATGLHRGRCSLPRRSIAADEMRGARRRRSWRSSHGAQRRAAVHDLGLCLAEREHVSAARVHVDGPAVEQRPVVRAEVADAQTPPGPRSRRAAETASSAEHDVAVRGRGRAPSGRARRAAIRRRRDERADRRAGRQRPGDPRARRRSARRAPARRALERGRAHVAGAVGVAQAAERSLGSSTHGSNGAHRGHWSLATVRSSLDREALAHLVLEAADHLLDLAAERADLRAGLRRAVAARAPAVDDERAVGQRVGRSARCGEARSRPGGARRRRRRGLRASIRVKSAVPSSSAEATSAASVSTCEAVGEVARGELGLVMREASQRRSDQWPE